MRDMVAQLELKIDDKGFVYANTLEDGCIRTKIAAENVDPENQSSIEEILREIIKNTICIEMNTNDTNTDNLYKIDNKVNEVKNQINTANFNFATIFDNFNINLIQKMDEIYLMLNERKIQDEEIGRIIYNKMNEIDNHPLEVKN
jgi:hypothetical protein